MTKIVAIARWHRFKNGLGLPVPVSRCHLMVLQMPAQSLGADRWRIFRYVNFSLRQNLIDSIHLEVAPE